MLRALAEALFDHEPPVPQERLDGFAEEVDRFVSPASKTLRFGLLLMLDVIRILPPFVIGRFAMFENVPLEARVEMLQRLERSKLAPLTLVLIAYKTILTLLFFENERELMATGYTGPDRVRWQKKALPVLSQAPSPHVLVTHERGTHAMGTHAMGTHTPPTETE